MAAGGIFMNLHTILAMGGYGAYVWTAYAITLAVFGINLLGSLKEKKLVEKMCRQHFNKSS
jgi:heme exporter protein CcmD